MTKRVTATRWRIAGLGAVRGDLVRRNVVRGDLVRRDLVGCHLVRDRLVVSAVGSNSSQKWKPHE